MTSRRGSSTAAGMCPQPSCLRNVCSSPPHSAAGRPWTSVTVAEPSTAMPDGRTRAMETCSSSSPISMPTPVPKASHFRKSVVIPPQNLDWWIVAGLAELHHGRYRSAQIGKAAVREAELGSRAKCIDSAAANLQASGARALGNGLQVLKILKRSGTTPFYDGSDAFRTNANGRKDRRLRGIDIHRAIVAVHGHTILHGASRV